MSPHDPHGLSAYKDILLSHEQEYRKSGGSEREEVIKTIIADIVTQKGGTIDESFMKGLDKVSQLVQTCNSEISSTLAQRIKTWYGNYKTVPNEDETTLVPVGTTWHHRLVVQYLHKEEIAEQVEASGLTPQDPNYLQQYQWCVNEVIKNLGGEDKISKEYGEKANSWNDAELPEELRRKSVLMWGLGCF